MRCSLQKRDANSKHFWLMVYNTHMLICIILSTHPLLAWCGSTQTNKQTKQKIMSRRKKEANGSKAHTNADIRMTGVKIRLHIHTLHTRAHNIQIIHSRRTQVMYPTHNTPVMILNARINYFVFPLDSDRFLLLSLSLGSVNQKYANVLELLLRLRQFCDHQLLLPQINGTYVCLCAMLCDRV